MTSMPERPSLGQRFFAWTLARYGPEYEVHAEATKQRLLSQVHGTVVEIGPGTGANLRYYPKGIRWIGIEPNPAMHPHLHAQAVSLGLQVDLRTGSADGIDLPDASADFVVGTWVLCSVEDVNRVLSNVRRVLKPGGAYLFMEHVVASPRTWQRLLQHLARPFSICFCGRCRPDRHTDHALIGAGFSDISIDRFELPVGLTSPHIAGRAIR